MKTVQVSAYVEITTFVKVTDYRTFEQARKQALAYVTKKWHLSNADNVKVSSYDKSNYDNIVTFEITISKREI